MGVLLDLVGRMPERWIHVAQSVRGRSARIKTMTDWLPNLLRNREGRIQRGLGRGLRFNGADSAVDFLLGTRDREVQHAIGRLLGPGMVAYDIGANVGFTAILAARRVTPSGRVVCFEPLRENAAQIVHNATLNGFSCIEVREFALAHQDGESAFSVSTSPTWGRLAASGPAPLQIGVIQVPVRSLDSLWSAQSIPPPDFIKMDVEGGESDVLVGGRALLAKTRPVMVIELHRTYHAVVEALAGLDYAVQPLTTTGRVASLDGEFQLLVYPTERAHVVEAVWRDLASGKTDFQ